MLSSVPVHMITIVLTMERSTETAWVAAKCAGNRCSSWFKTMSPASSFRVSTAKAPSWLQTITVTQVTFEAMSLKWGLYMSLSCSGEILTSGSLWVQCCSAVRSSTGSILSDRPFPRISVSFSLWLHMLSTELVFLSFLLVSKVGGSFPSKATGILENQSSNWRWSRERKLLPFEFCWWLEAVLICDGSTYTVAFPGARQNSSQLISFSWWKMTL